MNQIRTRFAPSPTGFLHVGGARTALYSYLFARKHKGTFILRIEDTDRERSTDESVQAILDSMAWLNLNYDEGPFYQTHRFDRYREVSEQFLLQGKAYRCYCTKERLEELRTQQVENKQKPRYDGLCRDKDLAHSDKPYVIRFKNPLSGDVVIDDQVYGKIIINNEELDDLIIARSDGTPTYNFTVVVDDWDMKITHVIRGDDHINNTPRQINMLLALGATLPVYAHVPMILGNDGKRLSKRHGAVSVMNYRDMGILPQALLNYLVRLGWSHGDQEIFSMDEMIEYFDLKNINKAPAAFNTEKLLWLNQHYMKTLPVEKVSEELKWHMQNINVEKGPSLENLVSVQCERFKTLKEIADKSTYFYQDEITYDQEAITKHITADAIPVLKMLKDELAELKDWDDIQIHHVITKVSETMQQKMGKVAQPLRIAVTGSTISPSIDVTIRLLGKDKTLKRLENFLVMRE